jgi:hypothetical protein
MIETIGSLVQETNNHLRWLGAATLHILGAVATSAFLGVLLGTAGMALPRPPLTVALAVGIAGAVAILYAASDLGLIDLPHPTLMSAVPVTWWRRWRPLRAPLMYGAALGLGVTTRIPFGAFYVLCILSFLRGSAMYGAMLMATYGLTRTLTVATASWITGSRGMATEQWLSMPFCDIRRVYAVATSSLMAAGSLLLAAAFVSMS